MRFDDDRDGDGAFVIVGISVGGGPVCWEDMQVFWGGRNGKARLGGTPRPPVGGEADDRRPGVVHHYRRDGIS